MVLPMVLMKFMYPPPESLVLGAISVASFVSLSNAGRLEIKGQNMKYSKFWKFSSSAYKIPNRTGMIVVYTPAFLVGISSVFLFPHEDLRFTLLRAAVTIHFFKRVLEVLFVHKYSGLMDFETMITISLSYFTSAAAMIYSQYLLKELPEPAIDLKYVGIAIFLLGIGGNFYHHYLLSKLRREGEKEYKIPKGGLFSLVICPHYLFEILVFFGISCISQTLYPISLTMGTTFYLMGRSFATRKWYESKFEDFPKNVKALIPFIF